MNRRILISTTALAALIGAGFIFAADVKPETTPVAQKTEAPKAAEAPKADATKPSVPVVEPTRRERDRGNRQAAPAARPAPTGPAPITVDTFRLIGERNIFNPNRIGRTRDRVDEAPPRGEVISFVGTMDYSKGRYAFFDGSDRGYQKTLSEGGKIGPFTVKNVSADGVDLVRDPNPFSLKMGQQLRKPVGGDWTLVSADIARAEAAAAAAAAAANNVDPNAPQAIPAGASEALRKLMERRNQQLKQ